MSRRRPIALLAALGCVALTLTACTSIPLKKPGTLSVVVGFYPIEFAAAQVGGTHVTITDLTKPGVEPHDIELTPLQVALIANADVVAYIPGLAPAVDEAVAQNNPKAALDVTQGITRLSAAADGAQSCPAGQSCPFVADPHVWLNPLNEAQIANNIATRLATLLPNDRSTFTAAYTALRTTLQRVDTAYTSGLKVCKTRTLVASHAAFGYLARAYDLHQVGISGLNPDAEPSPERLAAVAAIAKVSKVTTVYYERLVSPAVANTLASTLGLATAVLDPLEGAPPHGDYTTQMLANLTTLRTGQGCT